MSEWNCPNTFPEDWVKPTEIQETDYLEKRYADGVVVLIEPYEFDGEICISGFIETRYPDRGLHYEHAVNDDGEQLGIPAYFPDGIPED